MKPFALLPLFVAAPAHAHTGHLGELTGHDHWVAGAAIGAAVAVSVWSWWKGKQAEGATDAEAEAGSEAEPEAQEA